MSGNAVECALASVPAPSGGGKWAFFFVISEGQRGALAADERDIAVSTVKAFANWRECALAVAPIRNSLEKRGLPPSCFDADLAAVGFKPDGFLAERHEIYDVIDQFNTLQRRGKLPSTPTSPLPPDLADRINPDLVLRSTEIAEDVRARWEKVQSAYSTSTSDPILLALFAEFAKEARRGVPDRLIGDVACLASRAICDVLLDKPVGRGRQRTTAEQLGDVLAIVEAMPTVGFCQQAVSRLTRDARARFTAELNALGYETDICVDIVEFGPAGIAAACRAALGKITKPGQPAEKEAARALARGWAEVAGAGPRSARAQEFYARVNRLFKPGLNIKVERALR